MEDLNARLSHILDEVEAAAPADSPDGEAPVIMPPAGGSENAAAGGTSALLGGLLANPALLSAIPTLVENLSPLIDGTLRNGGGTGGAVRQAPLDRHTALLCAVKPYLGPERQAAADTILRLCRMWDALARSGLNLSGLLSALGGAAGTNRAEGKEMS